jgi:hypothetical protein
VIVVDADSDFTYNEGLMIFDPNVIVENDTVSEITKLP